MNDPAPLRTDPPARPDLLARRTAEIAAVALAVAAVMFLLWRAIDALLLVFAGLLLAVLLDAGTRGLGRVLPTSRGVRLTIVVCALAAVLTGLLLWGGYELVEQTDDFMRTLAKQLRDLRGELESTGLARPSDAAGGQAAARGEAQSILGAILPDPTALFGTAGSAVSAVFGVLGSLAVIFFTGLFVAASPERYRSGLLSLAPRDKRARLGEVLDDAAETLRWWLIGQSITMVFIGATTGLALFLIGMPGSLLLGLQAGLVNFVPYVGPLIAGIPILLTASAVGGSMVLWALLVYTAIQVVEGYVLTPLVQRRAVDLQPAFLLAAIVVAGTLFGSLAVALVTPLLAALRIIVVRLYVEDALGDHGVDRA